MIVSGSISVRTTIVIAMIEPPQPMPDRVVEEQENLLEHVDDRLEDVREDKHEDQRLTGGSWVAERGGAEEALAGDGVEPTVAERIAAQEAPHRQDRAAEYAELPDRLRGVGRAGRLVLAAARQRRRDQALVERDRRGRDARRSTLMRAPPATVGAAHRAR